ncbi:MAG TPA: metallophosphoesterase [Candidatus Sulfotelmatobacter sp.]
MPQCDVFIHAGDMTGRGSLEETAAFAEWLDMQMQGPTGPNHAIIVAGNHDECFEAVPETVRDMFGPRVHVLQDEPLLLGDLTFYGSPWTPPFMRWHFMAEEDRLDSLYQRIPQTVDVLITHGPPRDILDPGWIGAHVGSTALAEAIRSRHIRHHVFGHLHGAGGQTIQGANTAFYNVAACDEQYVFRNAPRVFDV